MKTITIPFLLRGLYGKRTVSVINAEHHHLKAYAEKEGITIGEAWHRRYGKGKQQTSESTSKPTHAKPIVEPSEKQLYENALRGYPDCYDMFPWEGEPTHKECVCPNKERPIALPQKDGRFFVDDPKKCHRCKALGKRKEKKQPLPKRTSEKKPKRQSYGRPQVNYGNSEGYSMLDDPYGLYQR